MIEYIIQQERRYLIDFMNKENLIMINLQKSRKFTEQKMYVETIRSFTETKFTNYSKKLSNHFE